MRGLIDHFTGLYTFSFAAIGVFFPLIGQYLAYIGFSGVEIGIVTASATAIGILSNSFWGAVYYRSNSSKKLIVILCIITALSAQSFIAVKQFEIFLLLYIIVFFFENPIFPLLDAMTIEANYPFGSARKWGAVGFALGIGIAGYIADLTGIISIFPMMGIFFILTGLLLGILIYQRRDFPSRIISSKLKRRNGAQRGSAKRQKKYGGYKKLLKNKKYMALLLCAFFFNGTSMAHNTYFGFLYKDAGGTVAGMGIALLLMVISETPFMAWSEKISARFTLERIIAIAMCVSALRWLWYSISPAPGLITAAFFLQGFTNGIILVETVKYISKLVSPDLISLAIPLYTALSSNCGTITCQLAGGILIEKSGGSGVYFFFGIFNIIGLAIYLICGLHKKADTKK